MNNLHGIGSSQDNRKVSTTTSKESSQIQAYESGNLDILPNELVEQILSRAFSKSSVNKNPALNIRLTCKRLCIISSENVFINKLNLNSIPFKDLYRILNVMESKIKSEIQKIRNEGRTELNEFLITKSGLPINWENRTPQMNTFALLVEEKITAFINDPNLCDDLEELINNSSKHNISKLTAKELIQEAVIANIETSDEIKQKFTQKDSLLIPWALIMNVDQIVDSHISKIHGSFNEMGNVIDSLIYYNNKPSLEKYINKLQYFYKIKFNENIIEFIDPMTRTIVGTCVSKYTYIINTHTDWSQFKPRARGFDVINNIIGKVAYFVWRNL